jgi:glycosyltransferase involved in cell wall biosynthesis
MNILLINHYAGSPILGMEFRPYYLAREWVKRGHRVRIVAASFSHVRTQQPRVGEAATFETVDEVEYCWLPTPPYRGNGAGRAWNIWRFVWPLWRGAAQLAAEFRPDVVIASSTYPMDIWVARRIASHARPKPARLVFEIHDLWPLSPIELSGMSRWHPFAMMCQRAENTAYRDADVVVSILPCVRQHVEAHGLASSKLALVPNGISPEEWAGEPEPLRADVADAVATHRRAGRTVVGYVGSMGLPNALDTLLDAAALLRQRPIGLVLVGDGFERERLSRRVVEERLDNVCLCTPIPKRQVPSFLKDVDIAYIGWRRVPIYRFGIAPNKLMDYMMAGCAVLHSVEAGNDLVVESGCGLSVPPEAASAVADGLQRMAALTPEQRRAMGARGRAFVLANHSYPVLAQRFLEAVEHHAR